MIEMGMREGDLRGEMVTSQRRSEQEGCLEKPWGLAGRHELEWAPFKSLMTLLYSVYQAVAGRLS